jgi:chromosomal replication initiator protein
MLTCFGSATDREISFAREDAWCTLSGTMEARPLSSLGAAQIRERRIEAIQQHVARTFGLQVEELNKKSTTRVVAIPRQIAMYLAKQMTDASLMEIGRCFGGKHHTTVMHSIAKIDQHRRADPTVNLAIDRLLKTLKP